MIRSFEDGSGAVFAEPGGESDVADELELGRMREREKNDDELSLAGGELADVDREFDVEWCAEFRDERSSIDDRATMEIVEWSSGGCVSTLGRDRDTDGLLRRLVGDVTL